MTSVSDPSVAARSPRSAMPQDPAHDRIESRDALGRAGEPRSRSRGPPGLHRPPAAVRRHRTTTRAAGCCLPSFQTKFRDNEREMCGTSGSRILRWAFACRVCVAIVRKIGGDLTFSLSCVIFGAGARFSGAINPSERYRHPWTHLAPRYRKRGPRVYCHTVSISPPAPPPPRRGALPLPLPPPPPLPSPDGGSPGGPFDDGVGHHAVGRLDGDAVVDLDVGTDDIVEDQEGRRSPPPPPPPLPLPDPPPRPATAAGAPAGHRLPGSACRRIRPQPPIPRR